MKQNDREEIITRALEEIKSEQGHDISFDDLNLADLQRRTGLSRQVLRKWKQDGYRFHPHARTGQKAEKTVLSGYTGILDNLLRQGIKNSKVCLERLREQGYTGGLTSVKTYIRSHNHLLPAKRHQVEPQGNRGRRYTTKPGEAFQMDWGFTNVSSNYETTYKAACFAMCCHHCGDDYVEFFPNARQENLFIGMIHGFQHLGVPEYVLTDNMKSVVLRRDAEGRPVWQKDYEIFMDTIGFRTKLCKPRHPFTKGKIERFIRYIKEHFLAGRSFANITELNEAAETWCTEQNRQVHPSLDGSPEEIHFHQCSAHLRTLEMNKEILKYLCPQRKISFDGFVSYDGRRFGVPYRYREKTCRVYRDRYYLHIYNNDLTEELAVHDVTWSRYDSYCDDQFVLNEPEEHPTAPVRTTIIQKDPQTNRTGYDKFRFGEEEIDG